MRGKHSLLVLYLIFTFGVDHCEALSAEDVLKDLKDLSVSELGELENTLEQIEEAPIAGVNIESMGEILPQVGVIIIQYYSGNSSMPDKTSLTKFEKLIVWYFVRHAGNFKHGGNL
uniref:Uncharacterized protein n=1 Tax=Strigamia maritima TaxID=126957 RepID=T1IGU2_STRMM